MLDINYIYYFVGAHVVGSVVDYYTAHLLEFDSRYEKKTIYEFYTGVCVA